MPSGPAAFLTLILLSPFLTWAVRHRLEQVGWVLECVGRGVGLTAGKKVGGG